MKQNINNHSNAIITNKLWKNHCSCHNSKYTSNTDTYHWNECTLFQHATVQFSWTPTIIKLYQVQDNIKSNQMQATLAPNNTNV